jgi:hypothetical protein
LRSHAGVEIISGKPGEGRWPASRI